MSSNMIGTVEVHKDELHSAEWVIPATAGTYSGCSQDFELRMAAHCEQPAHCPKGVKVKLQVQVQDGMVSFFVGLPSGTRARWSQWIGPSKRNMRSSSDDWRGKDPFLGKRSFGSVTEHAQGDVLRLGLSLLVVTQPGQFPLLPSTMTFGKELGSGSFGSVLEVTRYDSQPKKQFCAKIAKKGEISDFSTEAVMMRRLQGEKGFAELLGHFQKDNGEEVLVLQRLHRTLESLREDPKIGDADHLTPETVISVGIQLVRRLQYLHDLGFVHNDLKPENIMMCKNDGSLLGGGVLYLIDFGLSRHWRIYGRHVEMPTKDFGLMGTIRYCSIYAHKGWDSRRCDMESLAHLLIYLAVGSLPWQGLRVNRPQDRDNLILQVKKDRVKLEEHTKRGIRNEDLANVLLEMVHSCRELAFDAKPTYDEYVQKLKEASAVPRGEADIWPLDWVETSGKITQDCECEKDFCKHPEDCEDSCNCHCNPRNSTQAMKGRSEAGGGLCSRISAWLSPCIPCK